jgi:hypothetical protein
MSMEKTLLRREFDDFYLNYIHSHPEIVCDDITVMREQLAESYAKSYGKPIETYFHPFVISKEEYDDFVKITEEMSRIIEKVGRAYLTDSKVREAFSFNQQLEELILFDPGYERIMPIGRFDSLYNGETLKFCEFNADGSSGMNDTNTLEDLFARTKTFHEISHSYKLTSFDLRYSLLESILQNYREKHSKKNPNIAIVDWDGVRTIDEFRALKEVFENKGFPTIICDPRKLRRKAGRLWFDHFPIDIIYRRVVTTELMREFKDVGDFIEAYKNHEVCVVGSFRSEVAHSKLIFTILSDERFAYLFKDEEKRLIAKHIPWTRKLDGNEEAVSRAANNKDRYILKPHNAYGSKGVIIGKNCDQNQWEKALKGLEGKDYIVQEYVPAPEKLFADYRKGLDVEPKKINLSFFLYNNRLSGFYTRVSDISIITTSRGAVIVPTFLGRRKLKEEEIVW